MWQKMRISKLHMATCSGKTFSNTATNTHTPQCASHTPHNHHHIDNHANTKPSSSQQHPHTHTPYSLTHTLSHHTPLLSPLHITTPLLPHTLLTKHKIAATPANTLTNNIQAHTSLTERIRNTHSLSQPHKTSQQQHLMHPFNETHFPTQTKAPLQRQ
jgi:hypothetical protein